MSEEKIDTLLEKVDTEKRILLKRLILGTVFAVPAIASFPMDDLKVYALTNNGNMTTPPSIHS
jgi:hypothetical protein